MIASIHCVAGDMNAASDYRDCSIVSDFSIAGVSSVTGD